MATTIPTNQDCSNGTLYSINPVFEVEGQLRRRYRVIISSPGSSRRNTAARTTVTPLRSPTTSTSCRRPASLPRRQRTFPAIAGQATWESNMQNEVPYSNQGLPYRSGAYWCTNNNDTNPWWSLDNGNFAGYFDLPSSNYFEAWNYDGGRVYQQILDYDSEVLGHGYTPQWQRCTELAMDPYKQMMIATQRQFRQRAKPVRLRHGDESAPHGRHYQIRRPLTFCSTSPASTCTSAAAPMP